MDVQMPRLEGVSAARLVAGEGLADVLVPTTFGLGAYAFGALGAGAAGFLLKDTDTHGLPAAAVRTVARGQGRIAPAVTRHLIAESAARPVREPKPAPAALETLTRGEHEVLACPRGDLSDAEIALRPETAEATMKTHVSRLLGKPEPHRRVQAAALAQELGSQVKRRCIGPDLLTYGPDLSTLAAPRGVKAQSCP
nr:response regulator transcription factor [Streptomyces sp. Xyl84]